MTALIAALQQLLKDAGFDPGAIDGIWGAKSQAALDAWKASKRPAPPVAVTPPTPSSAVDPRSEATIATLHPQVQQPFRDLLNAINAQTISQLGLTAKWVSGYRNEAEQNEKVAQGFSKAHWPNSAHNGGGGPVGFACDSTFFDEHGIPVESGPKYAAASAIQVKTTRAMGFNSGADFNDPDHSALRPPSMRGMTETGFINEMIRCHNNGIPLWP